MSDEPKFKVGDRVAVYYRGTFHSAANVLKITAKKVTIRASNGLNYNSRGCLIDSDLWASGHIEPWTQKHADMMELSEMGYFLKDYKFGSLSLPQLRELKALLDKFEGEKEEQKP